MADTRPDWKRIKARFWTAIAPRNSLGIPVDVYYIPERRDITSRLSRRRGGRKERALPAGAVYVGTYSGGCPAAYMIEDLRAVA